MLWTIVLDEKSLPAMRVRFCVFLVGLSCIEIATFTVDDQSRSSTLYLDIGQE